MAKLKGVAGGVPPKGQASRASRLGLRIGTQAGERTSVPHGFDQAFEGTSVGALPASRDKPVGSARLDEIAERHGVQGQAHSTLRSGPAGEPQHLLAKPQPFGRIAHLKPHVTQCRYSHNSYPNPLSELPIEGGTPSVRGTTPRPGGASRTKGITNRHEPEVRVRALERLPFIQSLSRKLRQAALNMRACSTMTQCPQSATSISRAGSARPENLVPAARRQHLVVHAPERQHRAGDAA